MDIKNLLESSSDFKSQQAIAEALNKKWNKSGLLEGLDKQDRLSMAVLLENQAKRIVAEANGTNIGGATFKTGDGEQWAGIALPLIRKIFGEIAAKDFLSVQPMTLPSGLAFYLDFKYGDNWNGRKDGDNMYGNVSTWNRKMKVNEDVKGGLYGAGQFGYTINENKATVTFTTTTVASAVTGPDAIVYLRNIFGGQLSEDPGTSGKYLLRGVDVSGAKIYIVGKAGETLVDTRNKLSSFDHAGIRAFRLVDKDGNVATTWNEFTYYDGDSDNLYFFCDPKNTVEPTAVLFHVQPVDNNRGDFEAESSRAVDDSISIPEIDVKMGSEPIVSKTRKLKAQWTPEFAQDLNAYHSIDAEAELTSVLSEYISLEIDLELLDMLINGAVTVDYWSAKNNTFWNPETSSFVSDQTLGVTGYYNTQGGWFQTLGTKMQKVSNKVHQKTLRGGCTFMVCSPTVATIVESIPGFAAGTDGDKEEFAMGVQKVGSLNSRWKVYKNPYMLENVILTGYKGSQFLEAGAVYAPYIPLLMTPLVYDPETFTPRKGIMTRYAKKMLRPEFYAKIFVSDLETI